MNRKAEKTHFVRCIWPAEPDYVLVARYEDLTGRCFELSLPADRWDAMTLAEQRSLIDGQLRLTIAQKVAPEVVKS